MIIRVVSRIEKFVAYLSLALSCIGLFEKAVIYFSLAKKRAKKNRHSKEFGFRPQHKKKGRRGRYSARHSR